MNPEIKALMYKFLQEIIFAFPSDQFIAGHKLSDILKESSLSDTVAQAIEHQIICYLARSYLVRDHNSTGMYEFFSYFLSSSIWPLALSAKELFPNQFNHFDQNSAHKKIMEYENLVTLTDKFIKDFKKIQKINDKSLSLYPQLPETRFFSPTEPTKTESLKIHRGHYMLTDYSGPAYCPTERHTQYSTISSNFSNDESPLALKKESVELILTSPLNTTDYFEIFLIFIRKFYYLRDYLTPKDKITHTAEYLAKLDNRFPQDCFSEQNNLSQAIKTLGWINYLLATIHQAQQELKTDFSEFNYQQLSVSYTTLIGQLNKYRKQLIFLYYSTELGEKPVDEKVEFKKIIVVHERDVLATIHQLTKEKQLLEKNINSQNQTYSNTPKFRS